MDFKTLLVIALAACSMSSALAAPGVVFRGDGPTAVTIDKIHFSGHSRHMQQDFEVSITVGRDLSADSEVSLIVNQINVVTVEIRPELSSLMNFSDTEIGEMHTDRANAVIIQVSGRLARPGCFINDDGRDELNVYLYENGDHDIYIVRKDDCRLRTDLVESSYRP